MFFLLTGKTPFDIFENYINADKGQLEIIKLYPEVLSLNDKPIDETLGWHEIGNLGNPPDLGPEAGISEFDDINSSFYTGGNYSVELSSFSLLKEKTSENDSRENALLEEEKTLADPEISHERALNGLSDEEIEEMIDEFGEEMPEEEEEIEINVQEALKKIKNSNEIVDNTDDEEKNANGENNAEESLENADKEKETEEEVEIFVDEEQIDDEVEVIVEEGQNAEKEIEITIEEESAKETAEKAVIVEEEISEKAAEDIMDKTNDLEFKEETTEEETKGSAEEPVFEEEDLSFLNKFKTNIVNAQEYINQEIKSLVDLGEFRGASLKMSLAIRSKTESTETQPEEIKETQEENKSVLPEEAEGPLEEEAIENEIISSKLEAKEAKQTLEAAFPEESGDLPEEEPVVEGGIEEPKAIKEDAGDIIKEGQVEIIDISQEEAQIEIESQDENDLSFNDFIKQAKAQTGDSRIIIWYSFGNGKSGESKVWHKLDALKGNEMSNALNNGYLNFDLDFISSWEEVEKLDFKLEGIVEENDDILIYIDSLWVEAKYDLESELDILKKRQRWQEALELLSKQTVFSINEKVELSFKYTKNEERIWDTLSEMMGLGDFWQDVSLKIIVYDSQGQEQDLATAIIFEEDGEFSVSLEGAERGLRPGKYYLKFLVVDDSGDSEESFELIQDFSWGVLAFNADKSEYREGETAYLQIAVLDDTGHTICDADMEMEIISPDGNSKILTTVSGGITKNKECGPNNYINSPDYYAYYGPLAEGTYEVNIAANTENGPKRISDVFYVSKSSTLNVKRVGPTRIYPWENYWMKLEIEAEADFYGNIHEYAPSGFNIVDQYIDFKKGSSSYGFANERNGSQRVLSWNSLDIKTGDILEIAYEFDAPNVSPDFYLLGPLRLNLEDNSVFYEERRAWQIASDAEIGYAIDESIAIDSGTTETVDWTTVATTTADEFVGGDTYLIYVSAGFAGSDIAVSTDFEIVYGSNTQYTGFIEAPGDAYDAGQISWFDVYTQPATPEDVLLRYRTNSGASYALNAQIIVLNLSGLEGDQWSYNENTTLAQHGNNLPASRANVTLSSANGADDWFVMAMEEVQVDSNARSFVGEIYDGTNSYMQTVREGENTDELLPYVIFRPFNDVATNTNYAIRVYDDQQGVNYHVKSRVLAFNLTAFESYKTYYADINTALAADPSWTEVGNLNTGSNYAPQTTGDQLIFASWINDVGSGSGGTVDRLQVNNITVPSNWSWAQSPVPSKTSYDATDEIASNIVAQVSISDTGQPIDLDAAEIAGTTQVGDEVSLTVFSIKKKSVNPPFSIFNSAAARQDASGIVDISIDVDDTDDDNVSVELLYEAGTACAFSPGSDPTLDETPANISSDFGTVVIDNEQTYQIGSSTGWIETTSGTNTIQFDWQSLTDESSADGIYCLQITANDTLYDQTVVATTTVALDNVDPTAPGNLSLDSKAGVEITLAFGATTTETNFSEYKIFYKPYDGTAPDEADTPFSSSTDPNLGDKFFNDEATTTITGFSVGTTYSFSIWAYDTYGHKASSSWVNITANTAPTSTLVSAAQKQDGSGRVDIEIEVDDQDNHDTISAKIEYEAGSSCEFSAGAKAYIDDNTDNIQSDFGTPLVDNDREYQVGTTTGAVDGYIWTSPGSNTVNFDWLSTNDIPAADGDYCLRFSVTDSIDNQLGSSTRILTVDNVNPSSTGSLAAGTVTHDSIQLIYASTTPGSDSHAPAVDAYRIFYKEGISGVTEGNEEIHDDNLDAYDYSGGTATTVGNLLPDTWYVFNIWTYDDYGNKASATELAVKTNHTITNDSLTFTNAMASGTASNLVVADNESEWNFRAVVTDINGYAAIGSTTLRLADNSDDSAPFNDLEFYFDEASKTFYEIGADANDAVDLSENSTSTCAVNTCTIDFKLVFNKTFTSTSADYSAELISASDGVGADEDIYIDIYQVRYIYLAQTHYRWRHDNGGE